MVSDSIPPASDNHDKDCNKKKRANRSAKLKQCKMDARRQQWLSQVKNKGVKWEEKERFIGVVGEGNGNGKDLPLENKLEVKASREDTEEGNHEVSNSDSSPLNSPGSVASSELSGSNMSGTNFSRTSVSSGGTCSGTVTEDEDEKEDIVDESDGCVDDWEAIADAIADNDKKHASNCDLSNEKELSTCSELSFKSLQQGNSRGEVIKSQPQKVSKFNRGMRAWRTDDTHRPHGLPHLSKQRSLPMKSVRHLVHETASFGYFNKILSVSSVCDCPICYEELDITDASFFPCSCGFRMCLFCYNRICEDDGRCPSCRKHYKNVESLEGDYISEGSSSTLTLAHNLA